MAATKTFLVTYDLKGHESSSDYALLIKEIKAYGSVLHPLYSVWLIRTDASWTPVKVRDDLAAHIDRDDKLLVYEVTGDGSAWTRLSPAESAWIKATP